MSAALASAAAPGTARLAAGLAFLVVLVWLSVIDWRTGRLPDRIVLPMLWAGLLVNAWAEIFVSPREAVLGAACGYGALWFISAAYAIRGRLSPAFGGGDLKLAAAIGAWLGMDAIPATLLVAFVTGTCAVLPDLVRGRVRADQAVPFGPALAAGAAAVLLTSPSLAGLLVVGLG